MALKREKQKSRFAAAATITAACVAVASLAFISLDLALLSAGFFALGGFVAADIKRRRFFENGLSFRMKGLSDNITGLGNKIAGTRADILNLRQNIADINRRINDQDDRLDNIQSNTGVRPAATKTALVDEALPAAIKNVRRPVPPSGPRAMRPGQSKPLMAEAAPRIANDAEYDDLSDMVVRELVTHAVRSRTIDIFVQPVVRLPQRRVRFFEMYARIRARPGMYLPAQRYMKLAAQSQVVNEIDNMLLAECLKTIRSSAHVERAAPLFINVSQATLRNTLYLKKLLAFLSGNRHLAPRLVLEVALPEYKMLDAASREILRGLGKLGCSISLDHVDVLDFDIAELQKYHVRFVKIAARTLLPYTRSDKGRAGLQKQKRALESNGVSVIVEKVETEADLLELLDFDISYGQGHLFGRPDLEAAYRKRRAA